jgi:hypothetical protein
METRVWPPDDAVRTFRRPRGNTCATTFFKLNIILFMKNTKLSLDKLNNNKKPKIKRQKHHLTWGKDNPNSRVVWQLYCVTKMKKSKPLLSMLYFFYLQGHINNFIMQITIKRPLYPALKANCVMFVGAKSLFYCYNLQC